VLFGEWLDRDDQYKLQGAVAGLMERLDVKTEIRVEWGG
jgi:hypothetical protein